MNKRPKKNQWIKATVKIITQIAFFLDYFSIFFYHRLKFFGMDLSFLTFLVQLKLCSFRIRSIFYPFHGH